MSDSQEKSDDLIAELAKLMASNAQGTEAQAPQANRVAPSLESPIPASGPLRIPGMDAPRASAPAVPAAETAPVTPTLRIPGMSQPVAAATAPSPAPVAPAAAPTPAVGSQFDFGKPPGVAPVIAPEPMTNWQDREVSKPVSRNEPSFAPAAPAPLAPSTPPSSPVVDTPRPAAPRPAADLKPAANPIPVPVSRTEPPVSPYFPAPAAAKPQTPSNAPVGDGFDFDFGFGGDAPMGASHDPIADLIAAELDGAEAAVMPAPQAAPRPAPMAKVAPIAPISARPAPAAAPQPAPIRTFTSPTPAPVLVARPTGAPRAVPAPAPQPARQEGDRFTVAPVFGLGNKPAAPAPRSEPDPMDEIESLIGEAVRVELTPTEKSPTVSLAPPPPPVTPVVPPLSTQFAPRRTELKDREPPMQSAEAAILAAAAATGAEVGRLDATAEQRPYKRMKVKPPKSRAASGGMRQYIGIAVAGTLLLAAGFGLYWVLGMGRGDPATAPVLTVEAGSAKQPAPVVATTEPAEPVSGVFDQMQGKATPGGSETLVSRDETAGASPAEVTRVVGAEPAEDTEGGLANRKVRTVTVRPDGTIVPGDEAVAGNEELPVDRPIVPALPGGALEQSDLLANTGTEAIAGTEANTGTTDATATAAVADPIADAIAQTTAVPAETNPVTALVADTPDPAVTTAAIDPSVVAPVPQPRPSDRAVLVGGASRAVTLLAPDTATPSLDLGVPAQAADGPATQTATAATSGGSAAAYVQLSSQRSEGEAQASLQSAQSRFGSLLEGNSLEIQRADLGQKGIYFRVRLPAQTLQEATSICASIKANGGDCFATGS